MPFLLAQVQPSSTPDLTNWAGTLISLGGFGLLLVLLLTDRLYTRTNYEELRKERDAYKEALDTERSRNYELERAVEALTESSNLTNHLLTEIKEIPKGRRAT